MLDRQRKAAQVHGSIGSQLLLLVLAVALPLIGLVFYSSFTAVENEAEKARMSAHNMAQLTAIHVEQLLIDSETLLAQLAERPLVRDLDAEQCDPFLEELAPLFPRHQGVRVANALGQIICAAAVPAGTPLPSVADRAWFQQVSRTRAFTVSDVQVGRLTSTWVSVLAYPILTEQGEFAGAVTMPLNLERFQAHLDITALIPNSTITIVDSQGTVVARSLNPLAWIGHNMQGREIVDTVLAEGDGQTRAEGLDDVDRLYGFTTIPRANWYVYVGVPTETAYASVRAAMIQQGLLALAVILLVSLLAIYFKRQIEQPMHSLLEVAQSVAAGRLDRRAPVTGPAEFAEVAVQFNHMLDVREQHTAQLEQRARQLETLGRLGQAVASSLDLPVLLDRVLEHIKLLLPAEGVSIWVLEEDGWHCVASSGLIAAAGDSRQIPINTCILEEIIRRGDPVSLQDSDEASDLDSPFMQMVRENEPPIRVIQIVPLALHGTVTGMIQAVHSEPGALGSDDLQLLEAAATWVAIAIGNARQHEQLRGLAHQVILAQEEERKRLAQELHDEAGQALTALKFSLTLLQSDLPEHMDGENSTQSYRQRIQSAIELTDATGEQLRLLSHRLRPPLLSNLGLNSALQEFCREFGAYTGLSIAYSGDDLPLLPDSVSIAFYRFLQEALTNVAKHADAQEVQVTLNYDDDTISLQVSDDGQGFNLRETLSSAHTQGIGMLGMQERFRRLNGDCQIESKPGQGTRLTARCKLPRESITLPSEASRPSNPV